MSWRLLLLLFLLLTAVSKTPGLIRLHSLRDLAVFYGFWALAVGAILADMAGLPQFRPLDWVRSIMQLFL